MTIPVSDLLTRAGILLNDEGYVRWTEDELIGWLNDAAAAVVILRPAAGAVTETIELDAGAYHEIPEGGLQLLDVVRNLTSDDKPGKPIGKADRRQIDRVEPDWYARTPVKAMQRYTYDDRNPRAFYSYPPVKQGVKVEIMYSTPPAKVAAPDDTLDMHRAYMGPLVSYVLYRALSKDSEYANGQIALSHYQAFAQALGAHNETAVATSPKGAVNDAS